VGSVIKIGFHETADIFDFEGATKIIDFNQTKYDIGQVTEPDVRGITIDTFYALVVEWIVDLISLHLEEKQGIPVFKSFAETLTLSHALLTFATLILGLNMVLMCFVRNESTVFN